MTTYTNVLAMVLMGHNSNSVAVGKVRSDLSLEQLVVDLTFGW